MNARGRKILKSSRSESDDCRRASHDNSGERPQRPINWRRGSQLGHTKPIPARVERGLRDITGRGTEENEKEKMTDEREPHAGGDVNGPSNCVQGDVPAQTTKHQRQTISGERQREPPDANVPE